MINNVLYLCYILKSPQFLLSIISVSLLVKLYFIKVFIPQGLRKTTTKIPWFLLLGTLIGSLFGDIAWIVKLVREIAAPHSSYVLITFFIRIAWSLLIIQYLSLTFFLQSLTEKKFRLTVVKKLYIAISSIFSLYFLYLAFFNPLTLIDEHERELAKMLGNTPPFEIIIMRCVVLYLIPLIIIPGLYSTIKKLRTANLPKILRKQLKIFIVYLMCPYLIVEFLQAGHFNFTIMQVNLYPIVSISTLLITYAIYYCIRKVIGLRFLNFARHVHAPSTMMMITDFRHTLDQLSHATSIHELSHITNTFFKDAFQIPPRMVTLYIRSTTSTDKDNKAQDTRAIIEHFISTNEVLLHECIADHRILIYDEIAFTHFHEETEYNTLILSFLDTINADIFIPVYVQQKIIAYLTIARNVRISECYTDIERDEMLVFASYLGSIINVLHNRTIEPLLQQTKELNDELHTKYQEISQYKESIRSFLRNNMKHKMIGVIFYKARHFTFGNQIAKELIPINPNMQEGHILTKELKYIAQHVENYKTPQTRLIKDSDGKSLVIYGVPHLEHNMVIITISYPDISDVITKQMNLLYDPTMWEYLLYLETTRHGHLINQLIPGSGEIMLNFKIDLLKVALNKKPLMLDVPDNDIFSTVELLHHISGRETLYTLNLQGPSKNLDLAIKLFGISPIFGVKTTEGPLLEKLNAGTLFIKNIHFLDHETQKHLANFMHYGFFTILKSDQRITSSVRIICSSNENLQHLVQEGIFSQALFDILKKNMIVMPALLTLPTDELNNLVDCFAEQTMKTHTFKNILSLNEKDKHQFTIKRPTSLYECKARVQTILINKSKTYHLEYDHHLDPVYEVTDPELIQAARLGKHALKDPKIMTLLWNKFKNQNKIATFLGVNRSSVNRRFKEYSLPSYE